MNTHISILPMTSGAFAPFGDLLDCTGEPDKLINDGMCGRFHNRATLDFSDGRAGISMFQAKLRSLPHKLDMVERHPEGSQAFLPMSAFGFLVVVAADVNGVPDRPIAFLSEPGQGINFHRNTWHGVLAPLQGPGLFAVVDRIGAGDNLQEHWFDTPYVVE